MMVQQYTLRRLDASEMPRLEQHFQEFFPPGSIYGSEKYFRWKLYENPERDGIATVAESEASEVVSSATLTPKRVRLNGVSTLVAEIGDTYTNLQHLRKGLFLSLVTESWQSARDLGLAFVFGTPNENSYPGYVKKASFSRIEELTMESFMALCHVGPLMSKKAPRAPQSLLKFIGVIVTAGLKWWYRLRLLGQPTAQTGLEDRKFDAVPEGWERLINECYNFYDFILERERSTVEWRYVSNPYDYRLVTSYDNDVLQGYAIYRIQEDEGVKRIKVSDLLVHPCNKVVSRHLINLILAKAFASDVAQVEVWCASRSDLSVAISGCGLFKIGTKNVIARSVVESSLFHNLESVHFCMGDSDNG